MTEVFIYCDDPSHRPRRKKGRPDEPARLKVIKFYRIPHGQDRRPGWSEHPEVPLITCGVQLVGDDPPTAENPLMAALEAGKVRWRAVLGCRLCRVPLAARDTTLFAALDTIADGGDYEVRPGVSEISLSELRASVRRIST